MSPGSLTSEEVYERERDAKIEWGRGVADSFDQACRWFKRAGVPIVCRR